MVVHLETAVCHSLRASRANVCGSDRMFECNFSNFRIGFMRARVCSAFDLFLYPVATNIRVLMNSITSISAVFT